MRKRSEPSSDRRAAQAPLGPLFQLNTRLRLAELRATLGRPATLDDLSDAELDALAHAGFGAVWLLGVWQTGERSRRVSATQPAWLDEYRRVLPDFREADVCGSCFAVQAYRAHADFGGDAALARLRARLAQRGLKLLLDFVPNHVGLDHAWIEARPELLIAGDEAALRSEPANFVRVETAAGARIFAHGRDPNYPGWPDTLQLNYADPALHAAMIDELLAIAARCDGVRCDMAMLLLPEVFERSWGRTMAPFWPAAIQRVRQHQPDFVFVAEAYWDLESTLLQQGFDYAYDKRLYDGLRAAEPGAIRAQLAASPESQARLVRFLENHDEPRAAATFLPFAKHRAAAVIALCAPGLRLLHQGQREGRRVRVPPHLARAPREPDDPEVAAFYARLLVVLNDSILRQGAFQLLSARPAWADNPSHAAFVAFAWTLPGAPPRLIVANYAPHASQCYLPLPFAQSTSGSLHLADALSDARYERNAAQLTEPGLYLDLPAWGYHVFTLRGGEGPAT